MPFTIAYKMTSGRGETAALSRDDAIEQHADLTHAGASNLVIRNAALRVLTLAELALELDLEAPR